MKQCEYRKCEKEFQVWRWQGRPRKYCDDRCKMAEYRERKTARQERADREASGSQYADIGMVLCPCCAGTGWVFPLKQYDKISGGGTLHIP